MSVYRKENPLYLQQSINSVLNQTLLPAEIVIVKDGPLTNALDKVIEDFQREYPDLFKVVELPENVGLGKALNIGLKQCTHDIVARMDSDDICVPNRFEKQIKIMNEKKDIDVLGSWIGEFEKEPDKIINIRKVPVQPDKIRTYARYRNPLNHMTVMFRKRSVLEVGGYIHFLWNEDYYLWVRMLCQNKKIMNIPEILVKVRAGSDLYQRRGGLKYFINEFKLQKEFYQMKFISLFNFIYNIIIRFLVRIIPNRLRGYIYRNLLRSSGN